MEQNKKVSSFSMIVSKCDPNGPVPYLCHPVAKDGSACDRILERVWRNCVSICLCSRIPLPHRIEVGDYVRVISRISADYGERGRVCNVTELGVEVIGDRANTKVNAYFKLSIAR